MPRQSSAKRAALAAPPVQYQSLSASESGNQWLGHITESRSVGVVSDELQRIPATGEFNQVDRSDAACIICQ